MKKNREIKFRGKGDDGQWLYGSLIDCLCFRSILSIAVTMDTPIDMLGCEIIRGKVKDETIGQYAGPKDKNGKEIYEGDMLMRDGDPLCYVIRYSDNCAAFFAENDSFPHESKFLVDEDMSDWEVVGNIHDNPKLLED